MTGTTKKTADKPEKKDEGKKSSKEEMANDEFGHLPVERSGLSSIPHDDLNPAFAIDTSK